MRLNRFLAQSGLGSRRAVEALIEAGEIAVNGQVTRQPWHQVDPARDRVHARGGPVRPAAAHSYILLNKPRGYDVTRGGRHHHRRAWDLLPAGTHPSVQSVGRLDRDSAGLLLFTNDGELAFRLAHPRYGIRKVYEVVVQGRVGGAALRRLTEGIELEDGPARALSAEPVGPEDQDWTRLRLIMVEGRKRIVRRMCEAIGHPVMELERTAMGGIELGGLRRGKTRPLRPAEIRRLRRSVGLGENGSSRKDTKSQR